MRRLASVLVALGFLILVVGGAAAVLYWRYHQPNPALDVAKVVVVPSGAGLKSIARQLAGAGAIADPYTFMIGSQVSRSAGPLKAGEYAIPAHASMAEIAALLRSGKVLLHRLTLAEGLTSREAVDLVLADSTLSGHLDRVPAEGSLLPETYFFPLGTDRKDVLARMAAARRAALDRLWPQRSPDLPLSREQAVILASIVEKETALPGERSKVASVYLNRLRQNMHLDSDPTVVYGLTLGRGPLGRPLTAADLAAPSPFNTYRNAGLPPTPIANPGIASLRAVLNPAKTDALYFVADGTGGHVFARTLKEHNANVARWRALNQAGDKPARKPK